MDIGAIATAFLSAIGGVGVAYITGVFALKAKKAENEAEKQKGNNEELRVGFDSLQIVNDFMLLSIIMEKATLIFEDTTADRFLVLFAINGKRDFNYVNVICEQHKIDGFIQGSGEAQRRYKNVKIDNHYKGLLKNVISNGYEVIDAEKMAQSILKDYYTFEGVKHSVVKFLVRINKDPNNDIIMFCSVAKHTKDAFAENELNNIELYLNSGILDINNILKK